MQSLIIRLSSIISWTHVEGPYPSAAIKSSYSTASADRADAFVGSTFFLIFAVFYVSFDPNCRGVKFGSRHDGKTKDSVLEIYFIIVMVSLVSIYTTPLHKQDATQGHFFHVEIRGVEFSFSSQRPVAIPRLKSLVCPTILLIAGGE